MLSRDQKNFVVVFQCIFSLRKPILSFVKQNEIKHVRLWNKIILIFLVFFFFE